MSKEQETKFAQEPSKQRKISFFSAMLIVIGGSVGAGIFFKSGGVLGNAQSSLILAIISWILASFAVIAMGIALIEIASVKNDNLSLIGWAKVFNGKIVANATKNFMVYVYLPLTYFFMPLYVFLPLQDGIGSLINKDSFTFGTSADWLIWTIISLVMTVYFLVVPALWSKVGDVQNKIVTYIKFLPLAFVALLGIILAIIGKGGTADIHAGLDKAVTKTVAQGAQFKEIFGLGAGFGVFLSLTAIFFAYDGFYVAAGISSEMKEPKKTPLALFLGLGITTIIYIVIAISMSINGGSFYGMLDFMKNAMGEKAGRIVFGIMNIMIAIGVLGIINGFSMWAPRYVEDLLAQGELPFWKRVYKKLNPNKPVVGIVYSLVITIPVVIIFTLIGALGYLPGADYTIYSNDAKQSMARLYYFADLMSNWTALFTFGFITMSIFGAIRNKKTGKIKINQEVKGFKFYAWTAVLMVSAALLVTIAVPFIELFLLIGWSNQAVADTLKPAANPEANEVYLKQAQELFTNAIISRVLTVVTLLIYGALSFLPMPIENYVIKRKYGSLQRYELEKARILSTN